MYKNLNYLAIYILISILFSNCTAPRNITNSGKVTPKGNFIGGFNISGNIPSQTINSVNDVLKKSINTLSGKDSISIDADFNKINKAAIAYALDPLTVGSDLYLRYGVYDRFDIGFKKAGSTNILDVQYQFMGPIGSIENTTNKKVYGSVGLQFSSQKGELPSILADIQSRLGYTFKRKDILLPVIFSYSFGNEEEYGAVASGLILNYSKIRYTSTPFGIFDSNKKNIMGIEEEEGFFSFGSFVNCKFGYKFIFIVPAISLYWQDYGQYLLLSNDKVNLKGWTIIPSLGIKIRIGKNKI